MTTDSSLTVRSYMLQYSAPRGKCLKHVADVEIGKINK